MNAINSPITLDFSDHRDHVLINVDGKWLMIDTGRPFGYMPEAEGAPEGSWKDFFVTYGTWTTRLYRNEVEFGDRKVEMKFGAAPPDCPVHSATPWLVGGEFVRSGPIGFDLRNNRLHLFSTGSLDNTNANRRGSGEACDADLQDHGGGQDDLANPGLAMPEKRGN